MNSSIGKKATVALAGLLLCGFLVAHLVGNLYLLVGEDAFNRYAMKLEENPLLPVAEIILALLFLAHIVMSLRVKYENSRARPLAYADSQSKGGRTWGSRTMIFSGILVIAFLVIHLKTFKFGDDSAGLYRLVVGWFHNKWYVGFYVISMAALGLHLSHGFWSAFQTFGISHPRYTPWIKRAGWAFAATMMGGFGMLPLWAYFMLKGVK